MYCVNFRCSVINYYNKYITVSDNVVKDIQQIFSICSSTLYNWINLYKSYGNLNPKKIGRPEKSGKITRVVQNYIVKYFTVERKNNIRNLIRSIKRIFNIKIKRSSVYYILSSIKKKVNISYKKVSVNRSPFNDKEFDNKKEILKRELNIESPNDPIDKFDNVISFDESYMSPLKLIKEYDWEKKGIRVCRKINGKRCRKGKSMLLAISNSNKIKGERIN